MFETIKAAAAISVWAVLSVVILDQERRARRQARRETKARLMLERRRKEFSDMRWDVARYVAQLRRQEREKTAARCRGITLIRGGETAKEAFIEAERRRCKAI